MARTTEIGLPIADEYYELLEREIGELGRDRIAGLADIDPSTVHRNINERKLTYSTAVKLRDAIEKARKEERGKDLRWVPPPFFPVVSQGHYDLCEIAAKLHELDGKRFGELLEKGVSLLDEANKEHILESAKRRIAHPIRNDSD